MYTTSAFAEGEIQHGETLAPALAVYVCPQCKGPLAADQQALRCAACARAYPVRRDIPDFIGDDLRHRKNWSLRHAGLFNWLAPIYETKLWYPIVMRLAGVKGVTSLPQLIGTVAAMTGTVSGDLLDVACGPGTFGRRIATQATTVFGIDISAGMLEQGRTYAARENVPNVHFARATVEALPFADRRFATALCCGSLHLFEDTRVALREIARTLQPGAQLVGFTFAATESAFSRFALRHGARLFEAKSLGETLSETGLGDYSSQTFGSALLFRARKG